VHARVYVETAAPRAHIDRKTAAPHARIERDDLPF